MCVCGEGVLRQEVVSTCVCQQSVYRHNSHGNRRLHSCDDMLD